MTASKPSTEIKRINEGVEYANRVLFADAVVNLVRQQSHRRPNRTFNEPPMPHLI